MESIGSEDETSQYLHPVHSMTGSDLRRSLVVSLTVGSIALVLLLSAGSWGDLTPRLDSNYLFGFIGGFVVGTVLTVGLPILLYLQYGLRAPIAVLIVNLTFWLVVAGGGDAPGWFFAVAVWPIPVIGYLLVGLLERWLRGRRRNSATAAEMG